MKPISQLTDADLLMHERTAGSPNRPLTLVRREIKRRCARSARGDALARLYHMVPELECRRSVEEWDRILPETNETTLALRMAPNYYQAFRNSVRQVCAALAIDRSVCRRPNVRTFPYIQYWIAVRRDLLLVVDSAAASAVADEALQRELEKLDQLRAKKRRP